MSRTTTLVTGAHHAPTRYPRRVASAEPQDHEPLDPREVATLAPRAWFERAYRPREPQLTARALLTGLALGFVLSFANVYIGLATGWFFGMALTACLVSFGLWRALAALTLVRTPLGALEASCMQSTASSAAFATGNMVVGVVPALLLLSVSPAHPAGTPLAWPALAAWIAAVGALGVCLAIPFKRQLVDRERLPFPSGTAAAVMLHGLHRAGERTRLATRGLLAALAGGAAVPVLRDLRGVEVLGRASPVFDWLPRWTVGGVGYRMSDLGLVLDHSLLLVAAGVFVGLRITAWMLVGGLITTFVLGPYAVADVWRDGAGEAVAAASSLDRAWLDVGLWLGAPLLVGYALVAVAASWPAAVRTLTRRGHDDDDDPGRALQIPLRWFWLGFAGCGAAVVALGWALFAIPPLFGALAVVLSLGFSAVVCRIAGETDVMPGGPVGKLTQLVFGAVHPHHPATNLMTASLTHASSVAAADLLNDVKCGHLLGADPRRQFLAQAAGILAGTAASVLAYRLLVPDASALVGHDGQAPAFAAPAAHQFRAIASLMQHGLAHLHPLHRTLVVVGGLAGLALGVVERLAPRRLARWTPSAAGLGLGLVLPLPTSLSMALGAAVATSVVWRRPASASRVVWPVAAGALAGESLTGVVVALVNQL